MSEEAGENEQEVEERCTSCGWRLSEAARIICQQPTRHAPRVENDVPITDAQIEWREQLGQRLMLTMTCQHGSDYFGSGAVCETCFRNVQRIGHLIERIAAQAWDQGRAAERRDWEFAADLSTPDEDRQPWQNPYRVTTPAQTTPAAEENEAAEEVVK